jgi:hypothetical protein
MTALTSRDRWLLAALPTLAVLATWFVGLRDGYVVRRDAARMALEGAQATHGATTPAAIAEQRGLVESEWDDLQRRLSAVCARWSDPSRRAALVRCAAAVLERDGVELASSAAVPPTGNGNGIVPHGLLELSRAFAERGGVTPELWRFELNGSFGALAAAVDRMRAVDGFALPVAVAVTTQADGPLVLQLWVWI